MLVIRMMASDLVEELTIEQTFKKVGAALVVVTKVNIPKEESLTYQ